MKKLFTITLFSLLLPVIFGQEIKHYNLTVNFDILSKKIDVKGKVEIDFQNHDSIILALWKKSSIDNILIDKESANFSFDTICKSPNYYIPNGGKLIIWNTKNKQIKDIDFSYTCYMSTINNWAESFSEDWIQLGFYSAWYPVHINSKKFTSTIRISIDEGYKVSGSGIVTRDGNDWIITHNWPVFDNVIIASKDLKTRHISEDKIIVDVVYSQFSEKYIDSIATVCNNVYEFYQHIWAFGECISKICNKSDKRSWWLQQKKFCRS